METFLPRYLDVAMSRTRSSGDGYGLGPLSEPIGRLGLFGGTAIFAWLVLLKLIALPIVWPLLLVDCRLWPFSPDIASLLYRRRYRGELEAIVDDMSRIQEQEDAYLATRDAQGGAKSRLRPRSRQTEMEK